MILSHTVSRRGFLSGLAAGTGLLTVPAPVRRFWQVPRSTPTSPAPCRQPHFVVALDAGHGWQPLAIISSVGGGNPICVTTADHAADLFGRGSDIHAAVQFHLRDKAAPRPSFSFANAQGHIIS